ncbi:hypothetical protein [Streptomyces sp. NPDC048637]|uniref:hypothetical protein n=1 Tax=Streptomyces sp. NPDC048637 TaxID=3155636 RepID=UPI0034424FB6
MSAQPIFSGHELADTELSQEVGQLLGHSQIMLALSLVGVGAPTGARVNSS